MSTVFTRAQTKLFTEYLSRFLVVEFGQVEKSRSRIVTVYHVRKKKKTKNAYS